MSLILDGSAPCPAKKRALSLGSVSTTSTAFSKLAAKLKIMEFWRPEAPQRRFFFSNHFRQPVLGHLLSCAAV